MIFFALVAHAVAAFEDHVASMGYYSNSKVEQRMLRAADTCFKRQRACGLRFWTWEEHLLGRADRW